MNRSVAPLAAILDLNTDLLLNCLDGLTDEEVRHRLAGGGNSLAFLIAHLTDTRHFLSSRLKHPLPNPLTPALTEEELSESTVHRFPMDDSTRLGMIAFLTQHDSYHVGQAAFLRRQIGRPAMTYTRTAKV